LEHDFFKLLEKDKLEFLIHKSITTEKWESSINYQSNQNVEFFEYASHFISDIKGQLASKKMSKDSLLKILNELTVIIPQEKSKVEKFKPKLKESSDSFLIMQEWCGDILFEKFGIEPEDWIGSQKDYETDEQVVILSGKINDEYLELLTSNA